MYNIKKYLSKTVFFISVAALPFITSSYLSASDSHSSEIAYKGGTSRSYRGGGVGFRGNDFNRGGDSWNRGWDNTRWDSNRRWDNNWNSWGGGYYDGVNSGYYNTYPYSSYPYSTDPNSSNYYYYYNN